MSTFLITNRFREEMHALFSRLCFELGGLPLRLEIIEQKGATAYWKQGLVVINTEYVELGGRPYTEDVMYHELGHAHPVWLAPTTVKNIVVDHKMLEALLEREGSKWLPSRHNQFLNIVYDTIIDTLRTWEHGCNPMVVLETFEKKDPSDRSGYVPGSNQVAEWLTAFREVITGNDFSDWIGDEVKEAALASPGIIKKVWDARYRVKQISELLFPLFDKQFADEHNNLEDLLKALGVNPSGTKEGGDIDKMLDDIDLDDPDNRRILDKIIGSGIGAAPLNFEFERIWQKAGKKVRFQLNLKQPAPGQRLSAGYQPWVPGMPLRDLDMEATMSTYGRFLPGRTTLRPLTVEGPGTYTDAPQPNRMVVNCDVSGSMRRESTLLALFVFLREAQRRNKVVAADLFGDDHVVAPFSSNHRATAKHLFDRYHHAGGGNSVPGPENLVNQLKPGDLLLYVTDFGLNANDQEVANRSLLQLKGQGVTVVFILMFYEHYGTSTTLPYVFCEKIEDLSRITLTAI